MTSAAQFVEGGVQDACEDACSICLENFCEDDPATVTGCKHEYHLQCILEWSQRRKECPMCWQPLTLKDPDSQELLAAVEQERALRRNRVQPSTIYQRSPLEEYEFHRFSAYTDDSDFEERIMQHLAAAAMGRAHHVVRDPIRFRSSSGQGRQHYVIVPTQAASPLVPSSGVSGAAVIPAQPHGPLVVGQREPPVHSLAVGEQTGSTVGRPILATTNDGRIPETSNVDSYSFRSRSFSESSEESHHETSSSETPSFSETIKSRLAAYSSRYKESFTKTTRGFRDKLRARNSAMADLGARAREVSAGVVRVFERMSLETDKHKDGGEVPSRSTAISQTEVGNSSQPVIFVSESSNVQGSSGSSMSGTGTSVLAGSVIAGSSRVAPQPPLDERSSSLSASRHKGTDGNTSSGQDDPQAPVVPSIL